MNVHVDWDSKNNVWIVIDKDCWKSKSFEKYPTLTDIEEFVEENKK